MQCYKNSGTLEDVAEKGYKTVCVPKGKKIKKQKIVKTDLHVCNLEQEGNAADKGKNHENCEGCCTPDDRQIEKCNACGKHDEKFDECGHSVHKSVTVHVLKDAEVYACFCLHFRHTRSSRFL